MTIRRRRTRRPVRLLALLAAASAALGVGLLPVPVPVGASVAHASAALSFSNTHVTFAPQTVGTVSTKLVIVKNVGGASVTISKVAFPSGAKADFSAGTGCLPHGKPGTLAPGESCGIALVFLPAALGNRVSSLRVTDTASGSPQTISMQGVGTEGYYLGGPRGAVVPFGDGRALGGMEGHPLTAPIISMAATPNGGGYWLLGGDGGIFSFGNAGFFGSTGAMRLNRPVLDMASTRTGKGYWLVASDGGVFTFGDARFFGSTGGMRLNRPIVAMAATPSGKGYWLVASDGGVFTFGDAGFHGAGVGLSHGAVASIAATPQGKGYWLRTTMGAVYVFGDAPYYGDLVTSHVSGGVGFAATSPPLRPGRSATVFDTTDLGKLRRLAPLAEPAG